MVAETTNTIPENVLVLGITGSFGSGCSTLSEELRRIKFLKVSLSEGVKTIWLSEHPGRLITEAKRSELQEIGNRFRKDNDNEYFAQKAIEKANSQWVATQYDSVVFDNIRNMSEVKLLRGTFKKFYLVAVDCSQPERWNRIKQLYYQNDLSEADFRADDERDKGEAPSYGQHVRACVDESDLLIDNEESIIPIDAARKNLLGKMQDYIGLLRGDDKRTPTDDELIMGTAYAFSLRSKCIKRQVGAVIVDAEGKILSLGYNENPKAIPSCIDKIGKCKRDIAKRDFFNKLTRCPKCGTEQSFTYPYKCSNNQCNLNVEKFFGDRFMNQCSALHAEEKAMLDAGQRSLKGCGIYTTTFPCFTCAQKITHAGFDYVMYVEPYPDPDSARLLDDAGIGLMRFEGVKARAYFKLFGNWRKEKEQEALLE